MRTTRMVSVWDVHETAAMGTAMIIRTRTPTDTTTRRRTKGRGRRERLAQIASETRTTVIYEAPHRLLTLLEELEQQCGAERPVQVARELTKRHEQHVGPNVGAALAHFRQKTPQGECTVVLGGAPVAMDPEPDDSELQRRLQVKIKEGSSASEAARQLAMETGVPKRRLYSLLHQESSQAD